MTNNIENFNINFNDSNSSNSNIISNSCNSIF